MIKKKINNIQVQPVPIPKPKPENVAGFDLFPAAPYFNAFLLAKKRSGKSTVIFTILKHIAGPDTHIIVFSPTANLDKTWLAIQDYMAERDIQMTINDDLFTDKGVNLLDAYVKAIKRNEEEPDEPAAGQQLVVYNAMNGAKAYEEIPAEKQPKSRKVYPKYIIILDDMPAELMRNAAVTNLVKTHRHLKIACLFSSQSIFDLNPASYKQLDYILIWPGLEEKYIEELDKRLDLGVTAKELWRIYSDATAERYNFLWVGIRESAADAFRKNFNEQYNIGLKK